MLKFKIRGKRHKTESNVPIRETHNIASCEECQKRIKDHQNEANLNE